MAAMRMQVSEQGDEVFIELIGVAGRHQRILQVLTQGPVGRDAGLGETARETTDIAVRAGADEMHIRLKGRAGRMLEALAIYHYLRHALIEPATRDAVQADAVRPVATV
jgi:hypothetical protein